MIRPGRHSDIPQLMNLCVALRNESEIMRTISIDLGKLEHLLRLATSPEGEMLCLYVYELDGKVRGAVLGLEAEYFFSKERYASDLFLYVDQSCRRGLLSGLVARRLWQQFHDWAKARGVRELRNGVSTGIGIEAAHRFFLSVGMRHIGGLYALELTDDRRA